MKKKPEQPTERETVLTRELDQAYISIRDQQRQLNRKDQEALAKEQDVKVKFSVALLAVVLVAMIPLGVMYCEARDAKARIAEQEQLRLIKQHNNVCAQRLYDVLRSNMPHQDVNDGEGAEAFRLMFCDFILNNAKGNQ